MGVNGVFDAEGNNWERQRKPTAEALSLKKVRDFYPKIAATTGRLLEKWKGFAGIQERIDVQKELMRFTVDITTDIAFGYEMIPSTIKEQIFKNI